MITISANPPLKEFVQSKNASVETVRNVKNFTVE